MKSGKLLNYALAGSIVLGGLLGFHNPGSASSLGNDVADRADNYIGTKITNFGSGYFVSYVYGKEGEKVSSNLKTLSNQGKLILNKNKLEKGDIVFFGYSASKLLGAGIYTGNDKVVIAYKPYKTIKEISLNSGDGKRYFLGAKRIDSSDSKTDTKPDSSASVLAQKVIDAGKDYLGTPYEYSSSRSNTKTFDCSDFVRQAFLDGAEIKLPSDSRGQATYVKNKGNTTTDWKDLKPGDIMFFMDYKGWKKSDYKGINVSKQRISHDGIYLGNGKILHTYSKDSGGVRIDDIEGTHWEYRFMFGGSAF